MRPIYQPIIAVGNNSIAGTPLVFDQYISPGQVSIVAILNNASTSSATLSLQVTNDDIFAANYVPGTGNWITIANAFPTPALSTSNASQEATLTAVPRAARVVLNSCTNSPSVTLQVVQSGLGGT